MTYFGFRMLIVISMGCLFLGTPSAWAQEEGPSDPAVSTASEELRATDPTPSLTSSGEIDIEALAEEFELPSRILTPLIDNEQLELLLLPLTEEQLASASAAWQRIVQEQTQDVVDATLKVGEADGETADLFRERVAEIAEARRHMFANYIVVLNSWQKKGGSEEEIAKYRAYRNSIIIEELRKADAETLGQRVLKWAAARDGGVEIAIDVAVILVSLLGLLFLARVIRVLARRWLGRINGLSSLMSGFLSGTLYWVTFVLGLGLVLSVLGIDVTPLFALIGGISFILAFAMQETIANFFSGLMIMLNKPFDEGDYVDLESLTSGTVNKTNLISTTISTIDNKIVSIPNNRVWNSVITNVSASATRRVDMVFGISYSDSIELAIEVLKEVVEAHPLALKSPEPVICVGELADSSVNILCRPWSKNEDYWTLYWDMQQLVKERFDADGISIPFPQRSIHLDAESQKLLANADV